MSDASQRLDEVIGAYLQAVEAGTPPDRDQLLTRYPELAGALRTFFDNHDRLMRVGAPLRDAAGPTPGEMPTRQIARINAALQKTNERVVRVQACA